MEVSMKTLAVLSLTILVTGCGNLDYNREHRYDKEVEIATQLKNREEVPLLDWMLLNEEITRGGNIGLYEALKKKGITREEFLNKFLIRENFVVRMK